MAVKKHELVGDNHNELDLIALAHYFQLMNEQSNYLPPPLELIKHCQDIVKCLSRTVGTEEQLWLLLQPVEEFLLRAVTSVHCDIRHDIINAILDKLYSYISDPQSDPCPATAAVLVVIDELDEQSVLSAARWLVQQREDEPGGAGLRAALSCLYCWLYEWHGTPALGSWLIAYIKALEENERFDVLIETSLDNVENMFAAMGYPIPLRQTTADAIFHVLASLRESTEAFDKISPHVSHVLINLAADSGQWSRQLLQTLVDILTAMVDQILSNYSSEAQDLFRVKYADVILCLERHITSRASSFLQMSPWRSCSPNHNVVSANMRTRKVGLLNLGNTCYINSVLQALLAARQFSSHVVLKMDGKAYWSKISVLYAKMMHSASTALDPDDVFKAVKPPFFTWDHQHDSSEFLGYLFELLRSYEHISDIGYDYSRPAVLNSTNRVRMTVNPYNPSDDAGSSRNRSSISPPGSSAGSSTSAKRASPEQEERQIVMPPKKRYRALQTVARRGFFIDDMFGGSLLTRLECYDCHSFSLSRDVFRDLQLSFPEKPQEDKHSVQSLLEYYCSKERLSGDNKYECRDCRGLRDAERSVLIEKTPKYLILVLKNFKFDPKRQVHAKLMHSIFYNHTVALPTVRSQSGHCMYSLFATVIHSGTTIDSGHYYTLAKDTEQWYKYDDDDVSFAEESLFSKLRQSCTPYILFYKRSDVEENPPPPLDELPANLRELIMAHNKEYDVSTSTSTRQ